MRNRSWLLKRRPAGLLELDDFTFEEKAADTDLGPGQILVHNQIFLCAPTMRTWMTAETANFHPSVPLGGAVIAPAAGEIIASNHADYPVGARVSAFSSWQDIVKLDPARQRVNSIAEHLSLVEAMGPLGVNAQTGYFGLNHVGEARPGETVVVSAAAGSVGSVVAQLAKRRGCKVVGIAGGHEKCNWLTAEAGVDAAIDYKSESVLERLKQLCPEGVHLYFDNVGGAMLQAAVEVMARNGRIVLCGQISGYNDDRPVPGPENMMRLIYGSISVSGFVLSDYYSEMGRCLADLEAYHRAGMLSFRTDVRSGFMNLPLAMNDLFTGENKGVLLVSTDAEV